MGVLVVDGVVFVVLVAYLLARSVYPSEVAWFCTQYRVGLTSANGGLILDYLARTRRWRFYGAMGSLSVATSWNALFGRSGLNLIPVLFGGWFAGGILAELPVGRGRQAGRRAASLQPREVGDYVLPYVRGAVNASLALGILGVGLRGIAAIQVVDGSERAAKLIDLRALAGLVLLAAVVAALSLLAIRAVVRRPQPVATADVTDAHTATRRAAATRIGAGWAAIQFLVDAAILSRSAGPEPWNWVSGIAALFAIGGVLHAWAWVPSRMTPADDHAPADR